MCEEIDKILLF